MTASGTSSCSTAPSTSERELCLLVKQSANALRARRGHVAVDAAKASTGKGQRRFERSRAEEVQDANEPGNLMPTQPEAISVVIPIIHRKHSAEVAYVQRSVPSFVKELANQTLQVLVFGEKGEASSIALQHLKPLATRFQARRKHKQLKDPSKLKNAYGDSQEKVLWRSRLVLDFIAAASAVLTSQATATTHHLLWLEEDVELLPGFGSLLTDWLRQHAQRKDWLVLRLLGFRRDANRSTWAWGTAGWGGGGTLLYNGKHLRSYLDFLEANFDTAPLDWLHHSMPAFSEKWWQPKLEPVLLRHFGEHSTHERFL